MIRRPLFKPYIVESKILYLNISTSVSKYLEYSMSPVLFSFTYQTYLLNGLIYVIAKATTYRQMSWSFISWSLLPLMESWFPPSRPGVVLHSYAPSVVLDLWASGWSAKSFLQTSSAFSLGTSSMRTRLFLNRLLFTFRYSLWYTWWLVCLESCFLSSKCRILILLIQVNFLSIPALECLPMPTCPPFSWSKLKAIIFLTLS